MANESLKYLDRCRGLAKTRSDYALAKLLDIDERRINNYVHGKRVMDDFACLQVSRALGVPFEEVVAAANYDREPDERKKLEWAKHLKKLVPSFSVATYLWSFGGSLDAGRGLVLACDSLRIICSKVRTLIDCAYQRQLEWTCSAYRYTVA